MFRKVKKKESKIISLLEQDIPTPHCLTNNNPLYNCNTLIDENNETNINKIKLSIDKKIPKKTRGIKVTQIQHEEMPSESSKKEESKEHTIRKIFISETILKTKNPEELEKLLGVKREKADKMKEDKKRGLIDMQKEIFSLPACLDSHPSTTNDYVENLIKLSTAGIIEVPIPLEKKIKAVEETENRQENNQIQVDHKVAQELDYLKVLKKLGPSYAKGYKSDLSHKKLAKLNDVFENVFVNRNGRRMKFQREQIKEENRKLEEDLWEINHKRKVRKQRMRTKGSLFK